MSEFDSLDGELSLPQRLLSLGVSRCDEIGGCCGQGTYAPEFAGIGFVEFVFARVVSPIRIMAQHSGGNAQPEKYVVVAALGIRDSFRHPVIASAGRGVEIGFTGLLED